MSQKNSILRESDALRLSSRKKIFGGEKEVLPSISRRQSSPK